MEKEEARKACLQFLKDNEFGVVATITRNGLPQAATITYIVDDDFTIYFSTRRDTRKYENLEFHSVIAMVVGAGPISTSVQLEGNAKRLEGKEQEEAMKRFLVGRESYYRIFLKMPGYDFATFKITTTWMRFFTVKAGEKEHFTQII